MECPKCKFQNLEGMKFCGKCGSKLAILCDKCGFENPDGYSFCGKCGVALKKNKKSQNELSFDEKIDKIQHYLPKGITEKILSQKGNIEGERKQVTVLFCDLEGFTPLVEKLGPEESYDMMDQIYEILIHKVHEYEGTINEMTGDGVMALFGAPIALEDAPQRAIKSAISIQKEITKLSDKIFKKLPDIHSLKMRVGIHTGPVVVGTLGNNLRVEFKAVGDTVNLASRMEGLAKPGTTYVSEETFKLTEGFFRFESLGKKKIKGKKNPVGIYRVIAPSSRRTKFDVSAEQGLTYFIGRQRELEHLINGFERAKKGFGQAFSIVSEAGTGKSRLLYEFRKAMANEEVTFLEGKCLSYSKNIPYHPFVEILKSIFDIQEAEEDSDVIEKVKKGLQLLSIEESRSLPYLLELLSVKDSGIEKVQISPEARKDRIFEALKRVLLKSSEHRPLILAIEDLHWSDKSSEDVSKYLLDGIPGASVLLIFTYRTEKFLNPFGCKSYHSQVTLSQLSNKETLMMVAHLFGEGEIGRKLRDMILEKTEGIPFYIEEFIKSLINLKFIERRGKQYMLAKGIDAMTIPYTIQDIIMARVDLLPEPAKRVLQTGAAIEREFGYELIKKVSNMPQDELSSQLSVLKESELLFERGLYPETTYIFKHALTQEVIYDSILSKRKKKLHNDIGNVIETLYKENIDEHYGILAEHFIKGENYDKGACYSKLARKKSVKAASFDNAISYARKQIFCLGKLPDSEKTQKQLINTRTSLGLNFIQVDYPAKAKAAVEPIIDMAENLNYKRGLAPIYMILGQYEAQVEENLSKAFEHFEKALKISKETGDFITWVLTNWCIGITHFSDCEFEKAAHHFGQALEVNTAAKILWGISAMKTYLSWIYLFQGKLPHCHKTISEAVKLAEESGDVYSKATAYPVLGQYYFFIGNFKEAEKYLLLGANFSEKIGFWVFYLIALLWLGEVYHQTGKYRKSQSSIEKALWSSEWLKFGGSYNGWIKIALARAKIMNGEKGVLLDPIYTLEKKVNTKLYDGIVKRIIADILLCTEGEDLSKAEVWLKKSIEKNKQYGKIWDLAMDYMLYAELYLQKKDQFMAEEYFEKALKIFKICGADGWIDKYEKKLEKI